ncbi:MAG: penicillin-binding protein [Bdellovibrionaceae bacterium]|nr:penicillin-binding protein [Pseudobdellovibrionaceae bacterium]
MRLFTKLKYSVPIFFFLLTSIAILTAFSSEETEVEKVESQIKKNLEERQSVAKIITPHIKKNQFPTEIEFALKENDSQEKYSVEYNLDPRLQKEADGLFKRYKPDYGAVVLMEATTGKILALSSFQKDDQKAPNLALRASYPAASLFKIITASAAVEKAGVSPYHTIYFNGGNYTLYKKNVMSDKVTKWTRKITLKEAFARSINTAFGRLSLEKLEPTDLLEFANRFMFNQEIPADFEVEKGNAIVPLEKGFELTEVASGYNKNNTISPIQGAMIAGAVVNDGKMQIPYLVDHIKNQHGEVVYKGEPLDKGFIMTVESANQMRQMMEQTVLGGTSRKSFRQLVKDKRFKEIEMGGKTGHLTGDNPKGRVDWFIGYATDEENRKLAVAAITVNKKFWTVKSSYIGQFMFKSYFEPLMKKKSVAAR